MENGRRTGFGNRNGVRLELIDYRRRSVQTPDLHGLGLGLRIRGVDRIDYGQCAIDAGPEQEERTALTKRKVNDYECLFITFKFDAVRHTPCMDINVEVLPNRCEQHYFNLPNHTLSAYSSRRRSTEMEESSYTCSNEAYAREHNYQTDTNAKTIVWDLNNCG